MRMRESVSISVAETDNEIKLIMQIKIYFLLLIFEVSIIGSKYLAPEK